MTAVTGQVVSRASREAYRDRLVTLMARDERVVCLDSDTGLFTGVDFGQAARRYLNLGISEQNLMGSAAGLARGGRMPFVNTMAAFASSRAVEAVKIDIALNRVPVRIVATHGGLSAGHLGPTHHCLEDLAVMRALPNMTVVVPADASATEELIAQSLDHDGPVYFRLGRHATAELGRGGPVELGRAQRLAEGDDVTVVACGTEPVRFALEAADELAAEGVRATVLNTHTVKPLDAEAVLDAASTTRGVVTVEEAWRAGGLGSAVLEVLADAGLAVPVTRVGVADRFVSGTGKHLGLLARAGVTTAAVADAARAVVSGR
ncbi:transketolase C-terminal domain-containing protein [Actinosynnema sp. NPDC020468]|uniref:transketolase family protein n=1 Tax=Actinosynnema sp. NPDC020468 TaxID=3154488 RepID=UPI0034028195